MFGFALAPLLTQTAVAQAILPTGGHVVAGSASVGAPSSSSLTVLQTSSKAIVDWSSFSIGRGGTVRFDNGTGATLNRVSGGDLSSIQGLLSASGSVYLINPHGVIVGKDGVVDVGGRFVASTQGASAANFMAGGDLVFSGTSDAAIVNYGRIGSLGGDVVLIASRVENQGDISAPRGVAAMAAGYQVLLRDNALKDGAIAVRLGGPGVSALNAGQIAAAQVELRAQGGNVYALAGNTGSIINATGVQNLGGKVYLVAEGGETRVEGRIQARGAGGGPGFIETSGDRLTLGAARIDAGAGGQWLVDPVDLTVDNTAAGTIQTTLGAGTNVTLQTTASSASGPGNQSSGPGDIIIHAPISWSTSANLSLDAYHSIRITQPITISGSGASVGSVTLKSNDGGSGGTISYGTNGQIQFTGSGVDNSTGHLTINSVGYTLFSSLATADSLVTGTSGNNPTIALARSIDVSGNGTYSTPAIGGSGSTPFMGVFDGLGNSISNYTETTTGRGGLFFALGIVSNPSGDASIFVGNLRLVNVSISRSGAALPGQAAALTGLSFGTVFGVSASGTVSDSGTATVNQTAGLVGTNGSAGSGVVGIIKNSSSSVAVNVTGTTNNIGGLAGTNNGTITNSYATGPVTFSGTPTTNVLRAGGLVGSSNGTISNSYATGSVTYSGSATTLIYAGGLVGDLQFTSALVGSITDSYAGGAVTAPLAGGLIAHASSDGVHIPSVSNSYSYGAVSGTTKGGTIGFNDNAPGGYASFTNVYFDSTVNSGLSGAGTGSSTGITGQTTATLTNGSLPSGFSSTSWRARSGAYPIPNFRIFDVSASLTGSVSKTYDGTTAATLSSGNFSGPSGAISGDSVSLSTPTSGTYDTANAGTGKTVTATNVSITGTDAQYYELLSPTLTAAIGTISSQGLSVTLVGSVSKTYDGTTTAILNTGNYSISGVAPGDSLTITNTSGSYDSIHAGSGKTVTVTGLTLGGSSASNYSLLQTSASGAVGVINTKALTASLTGAISKVYNHTTAATLTSSNFQLAGVVGTDDVSIGNTSGTYDTKDVGTGKTVTVTGLSLAGGAAGDYSLSNSSVSAAIGAITKATLTASLTGTVTKVYDQTSSAALAAANYGLSGVFSGDTVTLNNPTSGSYNNGHVGTGKTVSATGLAISGASAGDYQLASTSISAAIGTITAKLLTPSLFSTIAKVYDGTTGATLAAGNYRLAGVISGDTVALNNPTSGNYDTKDAGTGKSVTVTGLAISGASSGDYALSSTSVSGAVGTITAKPLTVALIGSTTKMYDGNAGATLTSGNYSLPGVIGGDTVVLNNPTSGAYDTKDAGTGKSVTVTGLGISGPESNDYTLASTSTSGAIGTVTARPIDAALTGTVTKTYDGTTAATLATGNYNLSGVLGGDTVVVASTSGLYDTKNVGTGKLVTVPTLTLGGSDAIDYALNQTSLSAGIGTILAKALTASLTGTTSKTYDGTTDATLDPSNYLLAGVVAGDTVNLNDPTSGTYDTKDAGAGKLVSVTGLAINGADAGNYTLASTSAAGSIGSILAKSISASLTGTVSKTYDGTTAATLGTGNYSLSGVVAGDTVFVSTTSGTYDTRHAGTGKTVAVTGALLGGTDAADYALASTSLSGAVGTIGAKSLTALLTGTVSKTYDGTTAATLGAGNYSLPGVIAGDTVLLNDPISGLYDTRNAGIGKTVSVTGLSISGADVGDYVLSASSASGAIGTISAKILTAGLTGSISKVYDGSTAATLAAGNYALPGVIGADAVLLNDPSSGTYDTRHVGTGKTVTVTGLALSGADAGNYALASTSTSGAIGDITQKAITALLAGTVSKTYDGTTAATLAAGNYSLPGVIAGDVVALNDPTSGTYDDRHVGVGKTVAVTGLSISGAQAGDYALTSTAASGAVGTILAKILTASLTGTTSKVYDGTTFASIAAGNYSVSGIVGGDVLQIGNTAGAYDTQHVGTGKTVSVSSAVLTGADSGDYALSSTTVSGAIGTITQKTLTAGLTGTVSKTYDQTTSATLAAGNYTLPGVVSGDTVNLNDPTSGTYDSKDVGVLKLVTVNGLSISGASAGDYSLSSGTTSGNVGTILRRSITASLTGTVSRVYDGGRIVSDLGPNVTLTGVLAGDTVVPASTTGFYNSKDPGTSKLVTADGLTLTGTDGGDYSLASSTPSASIGTITARSVTASLTGSVSKVYDSQLGATLASNNYQLANMIGGDDVFIANTSGVYGSKNVGTGILVTVTGASLSGPDAIDYSLSNSTVSGGVGAITPFAITAGLVGTISKTYDGTTTSNLGGTAGLNLPGVFAGDSVNLAFSLFGNFDTRHVGTGKTVTYSGLSINGPDAANYALTSSTASANIGTITARGTTASLTGSVSKVYDGSTAALLAAGNYSLSNLIGGDVVGITNTSGLYDTKDAGTGKIISVTGLALGGADAGDYTLTSSSVSGAIGSILARTLTASLTGTASKTYDGTTAATLSAGNYSLPGVIAGDAVVLNDPSSGTYDTIHIGTGKTVSVTGLALGGAQAADYTLASTSIAGPIGTIIARILTTSLTGTVSKVYDGSTAATLAAGNYSLSNMVAGDTVGITNTSGTYDTKDAGTSKTVTVTALALGGANASDYTLASSTTSGAVGTITAKPITAGLTGLVSKTYDGTTAATLAAGNYSLPGIVAGDTVVLNDPTSGLYDTLHIGTGKTVAVTGLALSGAQAGDYALTSTSASAAVGTILARILTTSLTGTVSKVYDASTAATLAAGNYSLANVVAGDVVGITNTSGTYDTKDAGTGKTVTVTGLALGGTNASDYVLASTTTSGAVGTITARTLIASLTGSVSKTYDGTTSAALTAANYNLPGVFAGDTVLLNDPASGTYDTIHVGTGKTVSVTGLALGGAQAGDYTLASTSISGGIGSILARTLTASLTGSVRKVYDGSTAATLAASNYSLSGVVSGDVVGITNTSGRYDTKEAASGKTVTVTDLNIAGANASDYTLASSSVAGAVGLVTAKPVTASLTGSVSKTYDGNTIATLAASNYLLPGLISGDAVALNDPLHGTYDNKHVGTGKTVTVTGLALGGSNAGDYALTSTTASAAIGIVTRKHLSAALTGSVIKVYDASTAATLGVSNYRLGGVVSGDLVSITNTLGSYDNKNAGSGKTVTVADLNLAGASASDYDLSSRSVSGAVGTITPRPVTLAAEDAGKTVGLSDPELTYAIAEGTLASGDEVTGSETRASGENPGDYPIEQGTLQLSSNYRVSFVPGVFTITGLVIGGGGEQGGGGGVPDIPNNLALNSSPTLTPPGTGPQLPPTPPGIGVALIAQQQPYPDNLWISSDIHFGPAPQ